MVFPNSTATGVNGDLIATSTNNGAEAQAVLVVGADGHIKGTKNTYVAIYKLADVAGATALSIAFTANQERQIATLRHAATSERRKTIKRIEFYISATAATILNIELRRITSAPTAGAGSVAINPTPHVSDHVASDAVAIALPATAGLYAANTPLFAQEINLGANTAQTTGFSVQPIVIFPPTGMPADDDLFEPVIRALTLEGYAVSLRSTAIATIKGTVRIIYTEE
ncbi:MAG: hypothetical protein WKF79_00305 [Nocardioides sp.]